MILVSFLSLLLQQPVLGITSYVETKWEMYWLLCTRGKQIPAFSRSAWSILRPRVSMKAVMTLKGDEFCWSVGNTNLRYKMKSKRAYVQ